MISQKLRNILFLMRYYISNLLFFRVGGYLAEGRISQYKTFWSRLYEKNCGHRTWLVVANGPSLDVADLDLLNAIPSIASNKITLIYPNTNWRPSLFTIADPLLLFKLKSNDYSLVPYTLTSTSGFHMVRSENKAPWKMRTLEEAVSLYATRREIPEPISKGFFGSKTITISNIQIAMWLGAKKIYLIGCDHDYEEESSEYVQKLSHGETSNHFHPDYRKKGEIVNNAPIRAMNSGFEHIRRIADDHGIEIINVSRKTKLKTFKVSTVEAALKEYTVSG